MSQPCATQLAVPWHIRTTSGTQNQGWGLADISTALCTPHQSTKGIMTVNTDLGNCGKKWTWPILRYNSDTWLEGLRKIKQNLAPRLKPATRNNWVTDDVSYNFLLWYSNPQLFELQLPALLGYRPASFQPHYGPGVDSASYRNEHQESSWG
jgi:hypothetical protein